MAVTLIPVGHRVEITEFADIVHARDGSNGGTMYTPNRYPIVPRAALEVSRVYRARVTACTLVFEVGQPA